MVEPELPARKKPRNAPAPSGSSRRAAVARMPVVLVRIDDTDDDDDFVKTTNKRKHLKASNVVVSSDSSDVQPVPTKLARKWSIENVCLPSSPPLLRHGSPTVERHNSQSQQPTISDLFSQETLVANMSRANTAGSTSSIAMRHLELVASKASAQQYRRTASASKEALKGVDSELFDDPIDEFLTQNVVARSATADHGSEKGSQDGGSSPTLPGISQWYADNRERYIGVGDDSDAAPHGFESTDDIGIRVDSEQDGDSRPQSPLEGFCDLRELARTGGGGASIYLNQFGPAVRQQESQQASQQRSGGRSREAGDEDKGEDVREDVRSKRQQLDLVGSDDGYLDVAPSLNWEGGGTSRFGDDDDAEEELNEIDEILGERRDFTPLRKGGIGPGHTDFTRARTSAALIDLPRVGEYLDCQSTDQDIIRWVELCRERQRHIENNDI
ncbi:hypothetical protein GGF42_002055 [Coemansia sp. RSA 2424]|nr:hypothetical protein GGF42_002055 [Coemansia sp. RSA 2424]